jgi:Ankyrin repeat
MPRRLWRGAVRGSTISSSPPLSAACPGCRPISAIEYALIYAAGHGRAEVVRLLLRYGPDLAITEPVFHSTALDAARYHHRSDIEALLAPQ